MVSDQSNNLLIYYQKKNQNFQRRSNEYWCGTALLGAILSNNLALEK